LHLAPTQNIFYLYRVATFCVVINGSLFERINKALKLFSGAYGATGEQVAGATGEQVAGATGEQVAGATEADGVAGAAGDGVAGAAGDCMDGATGDRVAGDEATFVVHRVIDLFK
jgi:hypothetical protein